jgi:hypothetical protein
MRHFAAFAILLLAACIGDPTATGPDPHVGTYTLASIDRDTLPAQPDYSSASRWVVSGFLKLQPDGYFVLSQCDSVWNGRAFARQDWTEGGLWTTDGSTLTLSDTAAETIDPYGGGTTTYIGSIAASGVLLTVPTNDGMEVYTYRYRR